MIYLPEQKELIAKRAEARANKDWAESDRIRDLLLEQGIKLKRYG
jgi:cysteinyl-tRNA synthetase